MRILASDPVNLPLRSAICLSVSATSKPLILRGSVALGGYMLEVTWTGIPPPPFQATFVLRASTPALTELDYGGSLSGLFILFGRGRVSRTLPIVIKVKRQVLLIAYIGTILDTPLDLVVDSNQTVLCAV